MAYQLRLMSQADDLTIIHWPDVSVNNSQGFVHHFYYCHMSVENAIVSDIIVEEEATKLGIDIRKLKGTSIVESVPDDTWGRTKTEDCDPDDPEDTMPNLYILIKRILDRIAPPKEPQIA